MKNFRLKVAICAGLFLGFSNPESEKQYIKLHGQKYYKCGTIYESDQDTLFYPGGFTVIKSSTKITDYDAFCNGK